MIQINIKPLSANEAFKGRRYKTDKYRSYQTKLLYFLPPLKLPEPPYKLTYEFGFSSKGSDIDNPVKQLTDILSKKYKFNDNQIYKMELTKVVVPKGSEYLKFKIESLK